MGYNYRLITKLRGMLKTQCLKDTLVSTKIVAKSVCGASSSTLRSRLEVNDKWQEPS